MLKNCDTLHLTCNDIDNFLTVRFSVFSVFLFSLFVSYKKVRYSIPINEFLGNQIVSVCFNYRQNDCKNY